MASPARGHLFPVTPILAEEHVTVVATASAGDSARFRIPANARVERFIPHGPALDRAVCAVTHGGMGATQKALARVVPVCTVPFVRDQLEVARRVEVAGAGALLSAKRLRPDRLLSKIREAMTKAEGARQVAEAFTAAGGAGVRDATAHLDPGAAEGPLWLRGRFVSCSDWWAARDSNPDGSPHTPLKRARLPVPPAARLGAANPRHRAR